MATTLLAEAIASQDRQDDAVETGSMALLRDMRENSFWFPAGQSDDRSPIYMIYDPSCPHSARAMRGLEPQVRSGQINLRVSLAPITAPHALALAADILSDAAPQDVMFEQARHFGRITPAIDPADLHIDLLRGLQANIDLIAAHGIPGVPFFAWQSGTGPRFLAGVPREGHVFDAHREQP